MKIQWRPYLWDKPHPVDPQALDRIEQQWKVKLPEQCRKIVLIHQGMSPEPCAFNVGTGNDAFCVLLIVSADKEKELYSISKAHHVLQPHVPEGVLPFALTSGGEYLCFDYRDSLTQPRIVLVTIEMSIRPVADSFPAFLDGLYDG